MNTNHTNLTNIFLAHGSHRSHGFLPSALWTRDFFWTRISRITRICASRYCSQWIINPWDLWDPCAKNIRVIREIRVQKSRVQKIIIRVQKNSFVFKIQNWKIPNCGKAATIQNSKLKIQNSNHGSPRCSTTILTCCANRYFACLL